MYTIPMTLNITLPNNQPVIAVQGDYDSVQICATFVDDSGLSVSLSGKTVYFQIFKGNQSITLDTAAISSETAVATLLPAACATPGELRGEFQIIDSNGGKKVPAFRILVQSSPDSAVQTSDFKVLTESLGKIESAAENAQQAVTSADAAIAEIAQKQSDMDTAEATRAAAENQRDANESARIAAEEKREADTAAAVSSANNAAAAAGTAATAASDAAGKASHVPQYGDNGNWQQWDGTAYQDSGKPWKGEKGEKGDAFTVGGSYATLADLQAAHPSGDTKAYMVSGALYFWDGSAWKESTIPAPDLSEYLKASHAKETVSSETGVHGLRWFDSKLQALDADNNWQDISTGGGGNFAPADVSGLAAIAGDGKVTIAWDDPADSVVEGVTIAKWAGSKLVRKEGAYPTEPTDGILLVDNKVRGQYKDTGYVDAGLTNGTTYYYAVFPYADSGAVNTNEANRISAVPSAYPLPACTGISATAGNGQVTIVWSDPADVAGKVTWAGTKLVRKEGSYPTAVTDGVLLIDNTVRDQYKTAGYTDTGLTNGTTYYYGLYPYSTDGAVTIDAANRVSGVPQAYVKFGVRHHKNEPSPVLERLYDSANYMFTAKSPTQDYHSDFDNAPIYRDMRLCNVQNGQVTAYEGEPGFTRDGSNGDVCVEIPKFWYKVEDTTDYRDFVISDGPLDGFLVAPRHAPCDDYPQGVDKIYIGAYEAGAGYTSKSGVAPLVNQTRAQFRAGFKGRGSGCTMVDWATQFELEILYMVEVANLDSQSAVGNGHVNSSSAVVTGGTDTLGATSGTSGGDHPVIWRRMENLWGNVWEWRDGINFSGAVTYISTDPSHYADDTQAGYAKAGYAKASSNSYQSARGFDASFPWVQIPTAVSGSTSTYFCDSYYQNSGWRVASVGGYWNSSLDAGLFSLYSDYDSSFSYPYLGSRLLVLAP